MSGRLDTGRVLADSTLVVLATLLGGGVLFLANVYFAQRMGSEEFGRFRTVIGLVSLLVIFFDFGSGPSLLKYTAEKGARAARQLVRQVLPARALLFGGLALGLLALRGPLAERFLGSPERGGFFVAGAVFVLFVYFDIAKFLVLGQGKMGHYAGSISGVFVLNALLAAALLPSFGVRGALVGWGLGYLVGNLPAVVSLVRDGTFSRGPDVPVGKFVREFGLPMQLEQTLRGAEVGMIPFWSLFLDAFEVGLLAFALVFYRSLMSVLAAVGSVLFPRFARCSSDREGGRAVLRQALALTSLFALLGCAGVLVCTGPLIAALDVEYQDAVPLLQALLIYGFCSSLIVIAGLFYAATGRVRPAILATAAQQTGLYLTTWILLVVVS